MAQNYIPTHPPPTNSQHQVKKFKPVDNSFNFTSHCPLCRTQPSSSSLANKHHYNERHPTIYISMDQNSKQPIFTIIIPDRTLCSRSMRLTTMRWCLWAQATTPPSGETLMTVRKRRHEWLSSFSAFQVTGRVTVTWRGVTVAQRRSRRTILPRTPRGFPLWTAWLWTP